MRDGDFITLVGFEDFSGPHGDIDATIKEYFDKNIKYFSAECNKTKILYPITSPDFNSNWDIFVESECPGGKIKYIANWRKSNYEE